STPVPANPPATSARGFIAGHGLVGVTPTTTMTSGTKTIMQEPLAHLPKIRHGRQSTHDTQSLLPVTESAGVCPYSITQRERRIAIRSGDPPEAETAAGKRR